MAVAGCTYAAAPYAPTGFTDVPTGQFYTEPVAWAKASGITTGNDDDDLLAWRCGHPSPDGGVPPPDGLQPDRLACRRVHRCSCGSVLHGSVDWLKAFNITTGTGGGLYSPGDVVTRSQMAAFLHRMAGSPAGSPDAGFTDVPAGQFYSEGVNWLKAQNITTGTTDTTYARATQSPAHRWRPSSTGCRSLRAEAQVEREPVELSFCELSSVTAAGDSQWGPGRRVRSPLRSGVSVWIMVFRWRSAKVGARDLVDDFVGEARPDEWFGVIVPV